MGHRQVGEELLYHGRVFDLVRVRFQLPNAREHTYDLVKHAGAVVVVPVDPQGNILFVRQFRIGAQQMLLELPAGLLEEAESAQVSAAREVQEEVGMAARTMQELGFFYMVPGYSTEKMTVFLATGLYDSTLPQDDDEFLERVAIPISEALRMARQGELQDGKTLAAILLAQEALQRIAG